MRGNVAMTFALIMVPLAIAGGAAVDYSMMSRQNTNLQSALDAAALEGGRDLSELSDAKVRKLVRKSLRANLSRDEYRNIKNLKISIDRKKGSLHVAAKAEHPATFLRLAGKQILTYEPEAMVSNPNDGLEVVMVLDTTGSMSANGKIDALKNAATRFSNVMMDKNNFDPNRVKIGIVPFAQYVNVGMQYRNATWLSVENDSTSNQCWMKRDIISKSGCTTKTSYNDGVATGTYESCSNITYSEPYEVCGDISSIWKGCVGSRDYPLNLQDRKYNKRVPGVHNVSCPRPLTPLTNDRNTVLSEIDALSPSGNTYIPSGLAWGQRIISSGNPFQDGVSYKKAKKKNITKAIILMSDGENVSSARIPDSPLHNGGDLDKANDWTLEACGEIKKKEIVLFTIGFGADIPVDTLALLQQCSTNGSNYFHADDSAELDAAFQSINDRLSQLYLSR